VLAAGVVAAPPATAAPFVCTGRCQDVVVPSPAGVTVTSGNVRVLLPQNYATTTARYPVIYLLCGAGGNQTEWTNSSDLANASTGAAAIFVMPDCGGAAGKPGWYSDWSNGAYQWETYYIKTLLPWVDSHYRTRPGKRGIAGLSMGGYGAMALAARHPGLFVTAASFSGLPQTQYPGFSMVNAGIIPPGVWGSETTNAATWTAHDPSALAASLRGVSLYISCGSGDPSLYNGREEQISSIDSTAFVKALDAAGVPYHAGFYQGGAHTWPYFSMEASWALPQMLADLSS
jgi:diacylglycerol O-acyltransferase/trehalose O-mycolyltransferase